MPFLMKKKPKQQKSTAKSKPAVAPGKPLPKAEMKPRPPSLPPKYEPPKMPDYISERSQSKKTTTSSIAQQKRPDAKKEFLRVFGRLINRHRAWDVWRDFCGDVCLLSIKSG